MSRDIHPQPPRWATKLLEWRLSGDAFEEVAGDLQELFNGWVTRYGAKGARTRYVLNALGFLRPLPKRLRSKKNNLAYHNSSPLIPTQMLTNYFKIAWRNKVNNLINIAGLSIAITCALLIDIFIQNELSYDKFHKDADRIFQVVLNGNMNNEEFWGGNTAPPVGAALANNIPEIETYTRFYKPNDIVVRYEGNDTQEKFFTEKEVLAVDSNFLQVFDFEAIEGNTAIALMKPGSVVITEQIAKKYFGNEKAIGQVLLMTPEKKPFIVTAVLKNVPPQSSIQFDFLTPVADFPVVKRFSWSWVWRLMVCYVKLKENVPTDAVSIRKLEAKFPAVVRVEAADAFSWIGKPFDEFIKNGGKWDFHLLPLKDVHLLSGIINMPWMNHISNIKYVYIFGSISLFIILLACVNFMNLSTARAADRAKEVGIRKVAGSTRAQLVWQFLSEAFLFSFISTLFAVVVVSLLLKPFSNIISEPISFESLFTPTICISLIALMITVGLLAGSYPAVYLSSFQPAQVLKGKNLLAGSKKSLWIRNGLVVFQFTISAIMIVGTLVVLQQLKFFRSADLGFDKENVLVISSTSRLKQSEASFRDWLTRVPGVMNAAVSTSIPSAGSFGDSYQPQSEGNVETVKEINLNSFMVDEFFVPTLNIKVLKGRNFSKDFADSASVLLNEEAVKQIGWKNPLGKWLDYPGGNNVRFKVVGVVKNFHTESLQTAILPFALFHLSSKTYDIGASNIVAKIKSPDLPSVINQLEHKWNTFASTEPFDYNFLDTAFDAQYRSEQRLESIFSIFATLTIFLACLGLFGLCSYVSESRTKEIGIRKVLGASVINIINMLLKDFVRLVLLAFVIATPISWYFMNKWLQDFAYRINISWWIFIAAGMLAIVIALGTISFLAVKTAVANPVKSLRTE